jgi:hypothetical protein
MVIVVIAFAVIFLYRDVHVLVAADRRALIARFAAYAALLVAAMAIIGWFGGSQYGWTRRRFALAAVLIQLAEVGLALALRKRKGGRYCWIGSILPFPALPVGLFALSFSIRHMFTELGATLAAQIVTGSWLLLVAALAALLSAKQEEESIYRRFVDDFALLTSCTAFIFVPHVFF